jgi:hypothetical protein
MFEKVNPLLLNAPWVSQEIMDSLIFEPGTLYNIAEKLLKMKYQSKYIHLVTIINAYLRNICAPNNWVNEWYNIYFLFSLICKIIKLF